MSDDKEKKTELTQKQKDVLQQVDAFLQQFSDREQMVAAAYLAKYRGYKTCEESSTALRWAIQGAFEGSL